MHQNFICTNTYLLHSHTQDSKTMPAVIQRLVLTVLVLFSVLQFSYGEFEQWCVADPQTPDEELQVALDWACGRGGADCSKIQVNQPCYLPNTVKDHAAYAFNSYYQKFKNKGATCYFKGAAMITELDPSYKSCRYEYTP